ncbi:SMP-30/gluconolactonase/LRE family protein [Acrocarpospora catenulata]|uniref:SMP-30/gluconolactonase/LRE family protein n=1 Tax=Acrocarpospora catenulata TaxID=2836182 RepID=UPI001BDA0F9F|nr:SMP-30/gluconolactonase/LRE family protein [Acrocarpospora catenulata]
MIEVFSETPCRLGESALWDGRRLYWVDIPGHRLYAREWPDGEIRTLDLPEPVGSVALRAGGGLVAALRHAIAFCDLDRGTVDVVREVETDLPGTRLNDGAADPAGRFWFGSMDLAETDPTGSFYRLDPDLTVTRAFTGVICSNGPAWSPDGRTLYHVDSLRRVIHAYDHDPATGTLGPRRLFASDEGHPWFPDGLTIDAEGFLWNCKWDGARVTRYAPDGTIDRELPVPVPRPTRCAFIGPDHTTLAITTARIGLTPGALAEAPLSGHVLLTDPDARGLPAPVFAG